MIKLHRLPEYRGTTPGVFSVDDKAICYCIERPWLDNANDLSCIPTGTYALAKTFSHHFNKDMWEVLSVPGRAGIRIHTANKVSELQGCIAPCRMLTIDVNGVFGGNSRDAMAQLEEYLDKYKQITILKSDS